MQQWGFFFSYLWFFDVPQQPSITVWDLIVAVFKEPCFFLRVRCSKLRFPGKTSMFLQSIVGLENM